MPKKLKRLTDLLAESESLVRKSMAKFKELFPYPLPSWVLFELDGN
jgi:hypothetical protein